MSQYLLKVGPLTYVDPDCVTSVGWSQAFAEERPIIYKSDGGYVYADRYKTGDGKTPSEQMAACIRHINENRSFRR